MLVESFALEVACRSSYTRGLKINQFSNSVVIEESVALALIPLLWMRKLGEP